MKFNLYQKDKEKLIAYDNASIAEQDERGRLAAAENKGRTEGQIEGKIEGKIEEKESVVLRCIKEGMSAEIIAKIVELPLEAIQELITKSKK